MWRGGGRDNVNGKRRYHTDVIVMARVAIWLCAWLLRGGPHRTPGW